MSFERPYYEDINYHPFIFYVVFGVKDELLNVSRERHHVDEFPEGLNIMMYNETEHREYMKSMLGGTLGDIIKNQNPSLYEQASATSKWAIIRGEVKKDQTLDYMKNTIGFIQAFVETGAIGVLDLQIFTLMSAATWTETIFHKEFNPLDHLVILTSESEDESFWIHTRGMRKFGRPDVSLRGVNNDAVDDAIQLINQMMHYECLGVFFQKTTKLHLTERKSYIVQPHLVKNFENFDFNNAYYEILWDTCEKVE